MNEIEIKNQQYRIKQLNMIEVLALQSQLTFDSTDSTLNLYNDILERMEVKIGDNWIAVKQKGRQVFVPQNVENDFETIQTLVGHFLKYIKSVFQKSDE